MNTRNEVWYMKKNDNDNFKNNLLKVIYYDENSAIDYVTLKYGGDYDFEELKKSARKCNADGSVKNEVKVSPLTKILKFSTSLDSSIKADIENNNVFTSTIKTNTMVEFIKLCETNPSEMKRFDGYTLELDEKSITYLKIYLPYMKFIKPEVLNNSIDGLEQFDITKLDEILEITNGYYSFKAIKDGITQYIFRFNVNGLKNDYKLQDLIGMKLIYYGIKVGKSNLNGLDLVKQLNNENKNQNPYFEQDEELQSTEDREVEFDIYDIILAGVSCEN